MDKYQFTSHSYSTGDTRPPKKRGGFTAFVLVLLIFTMGIFSAMDMMDLEIVAPDGDSSLEAAPMRFSTVSVEPSTQAARETTEAPGLQLMDSPESIPNVTQEGGLSLQEIYKKNIQSVVSVISTGSEVTSGTGVIFSDLGYIVTNAHVISDASGIMVILNDESQYPATVVGVDATQDLAVLHISAENLTAAEFGDSSILQVGDSVAAIGDPLGQELRGTLTPGIISGIDREVALDGQSLTLIQTNAPLNPGNSGGPLLNCYGQVVGINTLKLTDSTGTTPVEGLSFAIPSTAVKETVERILFCQQPAPKASLGFTGQTVTDFEQCYYGLPAGVYITGVTPGTDAARQDICPGDILVSLCDESVTEASSVDILLEDYTPGQSVEVEIYRDGEVFQLMLILEESSG